MSGPTKPAREYLPGKESEQNSYEDSQGRHSVPASPVPKRA